MSAITLHISNIKPANISNNIYCVIRLNGTIIDLQQLNLINPLIIITKSNEDILRITCHQHSEIMDKLIGYVDLLPYQYFELFQQYDYYWFAIKNKLDENVGELLLKLEFVNDQSVSYTKCKYTISSVPDIRQSESIWNSIHNFKDKLHTGDLLKINSENNLYDRIKKFTSNKY